MSSPRSTTTTTPHRAPWAPRAQGTFQGARPHRSAVPGEPCTTVMPSRSAGARRRSHHRNPTHQNPMGSTSRGSNRRNQSDRRVEQSEGSRWIASATAEAAGARRNRRRRCHGGRGSRERESSGERENERESGAAAGSCLPSQRASGQNGPGRPSNLSKSAQSLSGLTKK
jgi:hypothetical protein